MIPPEFGSLLYVQHKKQLAKTNVWLLTINLFIYFNLLLLDLQPMPE